MRVVDCFLIEPTDQVLRKLRRYSRYDRDERCLRPGRSYHDASRAFDTAPVCWKVQDGYKAYVGNEEDTPPHDDPRWPHVCDCGYIFQEQDNWQLFIELLYRRADTGEETTLRDAPVGAMWDAFWMPAAWGKGPDGKALYVRTPGGDWHIDGRASNGSPGQPGWIRTGAPPKLTVAPSILQPHYHGHLIHGRLEEC